MRRRCELGCLLAMATCCATPVAFPCAPTSPLRQPLRPDRDSATYPQSAAPAATGAWGRARDGLQTRLALRTAQPAVGKPLLVRLEMRNTSRTAKRYDAQQAAVNHSLVISGPEGGPVRYIAGDFQTAGNARTIKPGETVALVARLDVTRQYLLAQPGRYALRFRGQRGGFRCEPDSRLQHACDFPGGWTALAAPGSPGPLATGNSQRVADFAVWYRNPFSTQPHRAQTGRYHGTSLVREQAAAPRGQRWAREKTNGWCNIWESIPSVMRTSPPRPRRASSGRRPRRRSRRR